MIYTRELGFEKGGRPCQVLIAEAQRRVWELEFGSKSYWGRGGPHHFVLVPSFEPVK